MSALIHKLHLPAQFSDELWTKWTKFVTKQVAVSQRMMFVQSFASFNLCWTCLFAEGLSKFPAYERVALKHRKYFRLGMGSVCVLKVSPSNHISHRKNLCVIKIWTWVACCEEKRNLPDYCIITHYNLKWTCMTYYLYENRAVLAWLEHWHLLIRSFGCRLACFHASFQSSLKSEVIRIQRETSHSLAANVLLGLAIAIIAFSCTLNDCQS